MMPLEQQPPLVKVNLHGILAAKYGASHEFAIRTPREAVWALDANFPGFYREFVKQERYIIVADDELRDGDSAAEITFARELHLVPKIEGQDPITLAATAITWATGGVIAGTAATIIGGILVVGILFGLSMLLRPKQEDKEDEAKDESYAFTGPENVTTQGAAVPLIYGRVFCGSVVISAGLSVSDVAIS